LHVRRLGYALGAEITRIDLRRPLDAATVDAIRDAWLEHIVLCFPAQPLGPSDLRAFASLFGELDDNARAQYMRHPDFDEVVVLVNRPAVVNGKSFPGGVVENWHTDLSATINPSVATFLTAQALPEIGGDTLFANMYAAYDALSPAFRELAGRLEGVHDTTLGATFDSEPPEVQADRRRRNPPVIHPVIETHPETGRKALYIGERIREFVGMTREETRPILEFLNAHATRYEFVYRHRWRVHDLVMWDNRAALHYAVSDYDQTQLRSMIRCSTRGPERGRFA
jgi:taurine dioxygenase